MRSFIPDYPVPYLVITNCTRAVITSVNYQTTNMTIHVTMIGRWSTAVPVVKTLRKNQKNQKVNHCVYTQYVENILTPKYCIVKGDVIGLNGHFLLPHTCMLEAVHF